MITMVLNGNRKINVWFWLIKFNIWCPFWLLNMCFDPRAHLANLCNCDYIYVLWVLIKIHQIVKPIWRFTKMWLLCGKFMSMPKTRIPRMTQVRVFHGRMFWLWSWEEVSHLSSWVFTFHWLEIILEMFPTKGYRNEWRW
jgi:hypothetical protein